MSLRIRPARARDEAAIAALRTALWPEGSLEEHAEETRAIVAGSPPSTMPLTIFVAEQASAIRSAASDGMPTHAEARSAGAGVGSPSGSGATNVIVGFVEVGLRSHADGCDPARPVGFVEGWYVAESHRGRGVGRALLRAAEDWSREHGCRELASDTWIDNEGSQAAHVALGFEVVDRCVHFKKRL